MSHLASGHLLKVFFWARGVEGVRAPGRENEKERGERRTKERCALRKFEFHDLSKERVLLSSWSEWVAIPKLGGLNITQTSISCFLQRESLATFYLFMG